MPGMIARKWRPPLLLVLGGTLGAVLTLPMAGLLALRWLSPLMGFRMSALLIGAAVVLASMVLGWLLWRLLLRPVRALADHAAAVRHGQPPAPLRHYGTRELRDLGKAVLDMAETLQNREATVRAFTDHVTHELKTPLTTIKGAAEMLETAPPDAPCDPRLIAAMAQATAQMEAQLGALRRLAAARDPGFHGHSTLMAVLPDLAASQPGLALTTSGERLFLPLSDEGLRLILGPLLANAAEQGAHAVDLEVAKQPHGPVLWVRDDGPGISPGNAERVFQPFFTTRRDSGGTGMGLAIVSALLTAHGGQIRHIPGKIGAQFRIDFAEE